MVLFNDMEADQRAPNPFIRWLFTICIICVMMVILFLGALRLIEGEEDHHKSGIEHSLSQFTGLDIDIGTLKDFSLIPNLRVQAQNLEFSVPQEGQPVHKIGSMDLNLPATSVLSGADRFYTLSFSDVHLRDQARRTHSIIENADIEGNTYNINLLSNGNKYEISFDLNVLEGPKKAYQFDILNNITIGSEYFQGSGRFLFKNNRLFWVGAGQINHRKSKMTYDCIVSTIDFKNYALDLKTIYAYTGNHVDKYRLSFSLNDAIKGRNIKDGAKNVLYKELCKKHPKNL